MLLVCSDLIRDIRDPEHPHTLEELNVVHEDCITVQYMTSDGHVITSPAVEGVGTPGGGVVSVGLSTCQHPEQGNPGCRDKVMY